MSNYFSGEDLKKSYYENQQEQFEGSFKSESVRSKFITKVFGIVSVQLMTTFLISVLAIQNKQIRNIIFQQQIFQISFAATIIIQLALYFSPKLGQKVPLNYICLFIYTLGMSTMVSQFVFLIDRNIALASLFLTISGTFTIAFYSITTKRDFTTGLFSIFLAKLVLASFVLRFFYNFELISILYSLASFVTFCGYLIYDIQTIMGNKSRKISIDDYILASLTVYQDIIHLFIKIAKFLNSIQKNVKGKKN